MQIQKSSSDQYLRRAFSWLARIGAIPKFGSRPIGWYQMHAHAALEYLEKTPGEMRCHNGIIQRRTPEGWRDIVTARQLYDIADSLTRK